MTRDTRLSLIMVRYVTSLILNLPPWSLVHVTDNVVLIVVVVCIFAAGGGGGDGERDVQMGSGLYERIIGDRWLSMLQISNQVLTIPGSNIGFDMEQAPYDDDNGIWTGWGWSYLNLKHPENFKFWMNSGTFFWNFAALRFFTRRKPF